MKFFFYNADQDVSGNGAPNLRLHRVLARAKKMRLMRRCCLIHLPSPSARAWHEIGLGTCHKEGSALMHWVKTFEVQIAPIREAEGPGFYWQDIAHIDIARLAVADDHEAWNAATQIEQRVELDRRLGGAKRSPIDQPTIQTVSREADIQLIVPRVAPHPPVVNYG